MIIRRAHYLTLSFFCTYILVCLMHNSCETCLSLVMYFWGCVCFAVFVRAPCACVLFGGGRSYRPRSRVVWGSELSYLFPRQQNLRNMECPDN